jgi:uncharacterized protein YdgA (DUF945 family)
MKRKLFFFTIGSLLFGFVVFIPYWTGVEAEKQFLLLNQHVPTHDAHLVLSDTTYQRGWLISQAQSMFEIARGVMSAEPQQVILEHKIEHGFLPIFPTIIYTSIAPQSPLVHWLGLTETPLLIKTSLQFDGSGNSQMRTLPLNFHDLNRHAKLHLQQIEGSATFTANLARMSGELRLPQLQLETDKGKVQVNNTIFTTKLQAHSGGLWLGLSQWQMEEVSLLSQTLPAVVLRQLKMSVDNQLIDKRLQVNLKSQLQQLAVKQENYGPGDITVEIRHLNVDSVNHIRQILNTMSNLPSARSNILLLGKLTQHGMALLNEQPELAIPQLNFAAPQGQLTGNLLLGVDKIDATAWLYPIKLLDSLHGKLVIQLPESLLNQILSTIAQPDISDGLQTTEGTQLAQTWLANWLKQGLITQQDQTYHLQAQLQNGTLDLNGRKIMLKNLWR